LRDVLLIVNPVAGGGSMGRRWPALEGRLRSAGLEFDSELTSYPGQATELARRAVRAGRPVVGGVGGDGTISEVANGFFEGAEPIPTASRLAVVAAGTGGDFRRTFGIPTEPDRAAAMLRAGRSRRIDAGRVTCTLPGGETTVRYLVNVADAGIGQEVLARVNGGFRLLNGPVTYAVAAGLALLRWRNRPMRVCVDDEVCEAVAQQVVVANGQYFGGGLRIAPTALPDDGLLDVVLVGDVGMVDNLRGMRKIRQGSHLGHPKITHLRGRRIEISSPTPLHVDVDGELPGMLPALVEVVPGALELVCP
jgi:YegS/Rv2252/BmrU family lipid kinase